MLELNPRPDSGSQRQKAPSKQPRRLLLALLLLAVAFAAVILRDHEFWFGSDQSSDADTTEPEVVQPAKSASSQASPSPSMPTAAPKKQAATASRPNHPRPVAENKSATRTPANATPKPAEPPVVATNRTAVAPLDVEVIAGDSHKTLRPGSNALKVEILKPGSTRATFAATNAAERERIAAPMSSQATLTAEYPALAQQMKVQGSVVLQAFIGADGVIQNLRVLSGPAILASAAQQAVREWHFKPYLQNGQAVETKATITVNFTIRVGDSSPTMS